MRYAFAIDHRSCIGCHACTVACKTEHDVPLGNFRTWVKYVERGTFPDARRYFTVLRCNHCANPPCVTICPTGALYKRDDGIVDFASDACIACKSCMQACPYDAIYIDAQTHTAAKCNFCAHRTEVGLEPACVIVCPEQAIVAGDADDPRSAISLLLAREASQVRKPEQNTRPNVYYVGADSASLAPTAIARGASYLWSQVHPEEARVTPPDAAQGYVTFDVHHPAPWGWKVVAYLWTKAIAAGALMAPATLVALHRATRDDRTLLGIVAPLVALLFNALTGALLIADLKRPERFHFLFTRGRLDSWLVRGAFILVAHALFCALIVALTWIWDPGSLRVLAWPGIAIGAATAGYTAFLFAQAEGRDLWQSKTLLLHLLADALVAGAAVLLVIDALAFQRETNDALTTLLMRALGALGVVIALDAFLPHRTREGAMGHRILTRGARSAEHWGAVLGGVVLPLGLLFVTRGWQAGVAASVLALAWIPVRANAFIRAGQEVPLS